MQDNGASAITRGADATSARAHGHHLPSSSLAHAHLPSPSVPAQSEDYKLPQYLPMMSSAAEGLARNDASQPLHPQYGAPACVLHTPDARYSSAHPSHASARAPPQPLSSSVSPPAVAGSPTPRGWADVSHAPPPIRFNAGDKGAALPQGAALQHYAHTHTTHTTHTRSTGVPHSPSYHAAQARAVETHTRAENTLSPPGGSAASYWMSLGPGGGGGGGRGTGGGGIVETGASGAGLRRRTRDVIAEQMDLTLNTVGESVNGFGQSFVDFFNGNFVPPHPGYSSPDAPTAGGRGVGGGVGGRAAHRQPRNTSVHLTPPQQQPHAAARVGERGGGRNRERDTEEQYAAGGGGYSRLAGPPISPPGSNGYASPPGCPQVYMCSVHASRLVYIYICIYIPTTHHA